MKKIILTIFVLFLVGCSKNEYITCNIDINNKVENYNMNGVYKIYYKDNFVTSIEKKETYISSDETMINYFNEVNNLEYYNLNDLYGGVSYEISSDETSVNLDVNINLELLDIKKMVKDNKIDKDYVISNKLTNLIQGTTDTYNYEESQEKLKKKISSLHNTRGSGQIQEIETSLEDVIGKINELNTSALAIDDIQKQVDLHDNDIIDLLKEQDKIKIQIKEYNKPK